MGPQPPSGASSSFDPFLSCHSHHINTDRSRGGLPPAQRIVRQQRSSSVPPSNGEQNANGGPPSATSSSARTTPMQSPSRRLTATIDLNVIPMFQRQPQLLSQHPPQQLLEPGLLNLMTQLAGGAERDPGMVNAIQNVLGQISRVMAGELTGRPAEGGPTVSQFLQSLPDYSYEEGESLLTDLLECVARVLTFRDIIGIVMGNSNAFARIQTPLRQFLHRRITNNGEVSIETAVLKLLDDNYPMLEETVRVAAVKEDIDLAETLHKFFEVKLAELARCILDTNQDQFPERFQTIIRQFLSDLTQLCLFSCTDGPASLERIVLNRLEAISGEVSSVIREWTMSSALGHVRTYIANQSQNSDDEAVSLAVQRYIVKRGSQDDLSRKETRMARALRSTPIDDSSSEIATASASSLNSANNNDDETFVTPRSSPERMEADVAVESQEDEEMQSEAAGGSEATSSAGSSPPLPPVVPANLPFPPELLNRGAVGPDMVVGGEPWHRALPSDWVPIIARDIQRQSDRSEQAPFSDAYLTTQAPKRRRLIAAEKPEGSVERVISDTLQDAISAANVEPATSVEHAMRDAASSVGVVDAVKSETRKFAKTRIDNDPDFKEVGDSFPNSKSFARK